jgi:hypothetical protein
MRLRENKLKIKIPIYDSDINLVITGDIYKSLVKICKKEDWLDLLEDIQDSGIGSAYFLYDDDSIGEYYMVLPYNANVFLISHEVLHATFIILDHHNVMYDKINHEAFTYLHGHIVETVYNKVKSLK